MSVQSRRPIDPARVIGTILLSLIGLFFVVTRHAKFGLGGDPTSTYKNDRVIHVDAHELDAVAIGAFIIALAIINLAIGVRDQRRIPIFWSGAGLFVAAVLYGLVQLVRNL